jgi:UDP-2-acetamido-3-amino-2,3-dideoxy-glucuronate N-acetyltransferase
MMLDPSVQVHPSALCETDHVGPRTRIWAFAHLLVGARVGADCNICDHTFVEDGACLGNNVTVKNGVQIWDRVTVEDDVFIGPNVTFTNDPRPRAFITGVPFELHPTLVRRGATIGANATIVCGTVIGVEALIAAGSVVCSDVPAHALMAGNPARRNGWACTCAVRLPDSLCCASCGRRFELVDEATGLSSAD